MRLRRSVVAATLMLAAVAAAGPATQALAGTPGAAAPGAVSAAGSPAPAPDEARILRYPDVSRTQIVFVHGGDLWIVDRAGGTAQRLTSGAGEELYPKFSPDGQWVAFSAEYTGNRQVWVVPAAGGVARQLTWYNDVGELPVRGGTDYRVLDWTPDGKNVVVRMNRLPFDERGGQPYLVPLAGGMEAPMEVPETGGGSLSPDGSHFVYTPIDADWRGWKRYRGGRAPEVWSYDLVHHTSAQLTRYVGMDQNPAWIGDTVYFASDRTGTLNLYAMPANAELESTASRALTRFTDFDVLWTSGGPDAVVFEQGGWLWRFDAGAAEAVRVPVRLADDAPRSLPHFVDAEATVESVSLSADAARVAFAARGELLTVPAKDGPARNLSNSPQARERGVSWSPDNKQLAYLSDATGEYEVWVRPADGSGAPRQLTRGGGAWKFTPVWSPDAAKLAFADKDLRLRVLDVASGALTEVDRGATSDIRDVAWSPDSKWLAYVKANEAYLSTIWAWTAGAAPRALTSGLENDWAPAWDPQGRWLYFLSNRDFSGFTWSSFEENYLYTHPTRVYAASVAADGPAFAPPRSDEAGAPKPDEGAAAASATTAATTAPAKKGKPADAPKPAAVKLEPAGFADRVVALDLPAGDYGALAANTTTVFALGGTIAAPAHDLVTWSIADRKAGKVAANVADFQLSGDGAHLLVHADAGWSIVKAEPDQDLAAAVVPVAGVQLRVDPMVERRQKYTDAWRILRDWFYEPGVHGGLPRWEAIRDRYAPLAAAATTPGDLDYVLHELAGEANAGHVYVERAPDPDAPPRKESGLLGAEFAPSPGGRGPFRITRIFAGENWASATRSPLTEPGVGVHVGDWLLGVDGVPASSVANVYQLLDGKGDQLVELRVNTRPSEDGAHTVLVRTLTSERDLRYLAWTAERRALVDKLSGGRIGYVHVPNTAQEGNNALMRWMPALVAKEALIIDDRYNGGGFIPDRMAELLGRQPLSWWKVRGQDPAPTPLLSHRGPKAMLINGLSSSGGDAFPYYFRELKLGPLVGTRTWGGLIGLSGQPGLVDGGAIEVPTFRFLGNDGKWAVENEGVAPDVEVVDRPELVAAGRDPSVEKAVELLLAELAAHPVVPVKAPPAPVEFK